MQYIWPLWSAPDSNAVKKPEVELSQRNRDLSPKEKPWEEALEELVIGQDSKSDGRVVLLLCLSGCSPQGPA